MLDTVGERAKGVGGPQRPQLGRADPARAARPPETPAVEPQEIADAR
jgi:hypothetical protein